MILIVYHTVARWEEEQIARALERLGASYRLMDISREPIKIGSKIPGDPSIAIQRSVSRIAALESTVALEGSGVRVINNSLSIATSQSKIWCLSTLARSGIPIPESYASFGPSSIEKGAEDLGYPVVYKPSQGSWGRLVSMARDPGELSALIAHRESLGPQALYGIVQEYVKKPWRDIRATVIGDQVISIYRINKTHWITNTARGAEARPVPKDPELEDLAIKAARALGLEVAGIDIFEDPERGYIVNEANPVPEFKNVARVTGVDIAGIVAEYVLSQANL
ncbi:MAG TPA: lysine biosynthesis protein LysX [Sulfolobales archaeon]|nr:lysine biosynthesis protein LysX [Sulfolobales archaeon]